VRTTLTLDEDVAERLQAIARRSGQPFRTVVNETLRSGLNAMKPPRPAPQFVWTELPLSVGTQFESTSEHLERLDGLDAR